MIINSKSVVNRGDIMMRASYNGLRLENCEDKIFIVAFRTVSRYVRKDVRPFLVYDYQEALQPSKSLNNDYEAGLVDEVEYTRRYMNEGNYEKALLELAQLEKDSGKEVVLCCWEGDDKFCHTNILLKELEYFIIKGMLEEDRKAINKRVKKSRR